MAARRRRSSWFPTYPPRRTWLGVGVGVGLRVGLGLGLLLRALALTLTLPLPLARLMAGREEAEARRALGPHAAVVGAAVGVGVG